MKISSAWRCYCVLALLLGHQWSSHHASGRDDGMMMISTLAGVAAAVPEIPPVDFGTTLVAVLFDHGVVLAADSRTTTGQYVANRWAQKLSIVTDFCCLARSGQAAASQALTGQIRQFVTSRWYRYGTRCSVSQIAKWLQHALYGRNSSYNGSAEGASVSLLVAGVEHRLSSQEDELDPSDQRQGHLQRGRCSRIYCLSATGALWEEEDYAAAGSGSAVILGYLDQYFAQKRLERFAKHKKQQLTSSQVGSHRQDEARDHDRLVRWNQHRQRGCVRLSQEEAIELCRTCIERAIDRDGASGGLIRMVLVHTCDGCRQWTYWPRRRSASATATLSHSLPGFANPSQQSR